ncbi:hypothetical protein C8Q75DRAFT_394949 [Abortiporus biennis]|nr:hypothetical protein C8Q75DRAFT_394949 [Abortiporus biennis]
MHITTQVPRLPPELVDHIIDFLYDEKPTLPSCCLVARSWLASSRYHLFYTTTAYGLTVGERYRLPSSDRRVQHKFLDFSKFITSSPHIAQYIKVLRLCGRSERRLPFQGVLYFTILIDIIHGLTSLKSLIMDGILLQVSKRTGSFRQSDYLHYMDSDFEDTELDFEDTDSETEEDVKLKLLDQAISRSKLLMQRRTLDELVLRDFVISPYQGRFGIQVITSLMSLFASVDALVLDDFWSEPVAEDYSEMAETMRPWIEQQVSQGRVGHVKLNKLQVEATQSCRMILEWLKYSPSPMTLRHLDIDCDSAGLLEALGAFLLAGGPDLKLVTCRVGVTMYMTDLDDVFRPIELPTFSACTSLESFHIDLRICPVDYTNLQRFANIGIDMFTSLPKSTHKKPTLPPLRHLKFTFRDPMASWDVNPLFTSSNEYVDWSRIKETVLRYPNLERFSVDMYANNFGDRLRGVEKAMIRRRLWNLEHVLYIE